MSGVENADSPMEVKWPRLDVVVGKNRKIGLPDR